MAGASKGRAGFGVRVMTGAAIVAAALTVGGSEPSWADPPAPIVYAKALGPQSAPQFANGRLSNRVEFLPPGSAQVAAAGPIDLRPGAVKASFGPALSVSSRFEPVRPLMSAPASEFSAPTAFAEPYAGPPYQVDGKWYVPTYEPNYDEVGTASWYGPTFHGKASASGEQFDENAMTAAHPTLPIPSLVRVSNLENGKSIVVRLNDRGPFVDDRIIDLSRAAGAALNMHAKGTAKVRVQYLSAAPAAPNSLPAQAVQVQVSAPVVAPHPELTPSIARQSLPSLVPPSSAQALGVADLRGYFLQAGSFADLGNAHALRDKLKAFGPVSVTTVQINGSAFYRVMLGPWSSSVEAQQAQDRLVVEASTKAILIAKPD